eukprot:TRINITY_DN53453_c0_g1_i1.p1 TRINITY_DN53453_c0_g1~~TRINITY_DN53453_c0_g1_i1.p1  ORF type:complete len:128 (+),score=9.53 TRINITY_DN53453_c0_g1_i1:196-579(+)
MCIRDRHKTHVSDTQRVVISSKDYLGLWKREGGGRRKRERKGSPPQNTHTSRLLREPACCWLKPPSLVVVLLPQPLLEVIKNTQQKKTHVLYYLSLIHISEPTRLLSISYAVFCLKKKNRITINYLN